MSLRCMNRVKLRGVSGAVRAQTQTYTHSRTRTRSQPLTLTPETLGGRKARPQELPAAQRPGKPRECACGTGAPGALTRKRRRGGAETVKGEPGDLTARSSRVARTLPGSRGLISRARARANRRKSQGPGAERAGEEEPGGQGRGREEELGDWTGRGAGSGRSLDAGGGAYRGVGGARQPGLGGQAYSPWRGVQSSMKKAKEAGSALETGPRLQAETSGLKGSGSARDIYKEAVTFLASQFPQL